MRRVLWKAKGEITLKFLLNENVSEAVSFALARLGYEAVMSRDYLGKGVTDREILDRAVKEEWIVITCDTDFGYMVHKQGMDHVGVVLLRLKDQRPANQVKAVEKALKKSLIEKGKFVSLKD